MKFPVKISNIQKKVLKKSFIVIKKNCQIYVSKKYSK